MNRIKKNIATFKHIEILGGIDLLDANFGDQNFSRHFHDGYAFGVITKGQLDFTYLHKNWQAQPGDINLVVPGEVHDGHGKDATGWAYKMFYLPAELLIKINMQRTDQDKLPWFSSGVVNHGLLAEKLLQLHNQLTASMQDLLQQETLITDWLTCFIEQFSSDKPKIQRIGTEPQSIKLCLDYIHEYYREQISLTTLAELTKLSPYHLLRSFKSQIGVPIHLYQQQLRISKAKALLLSGTPPAAIAADLGFTDQSHFYHQFKKITGLTPGSLQTNSNV